MVSPGRRYVPRPFFAFGNAVDATIAIGNVAHGTIAIGLSLSVGVVSIGVNAVGSFAAFGVNAAAPIAVAAVNGVGVFVLAGVNGVGALGAAGVNGAVEPVAGVVIAALLFVIAYAHSSVAVRNAAPEPLEHYPRTVPLSIAREQGGWTRADRLEVNGDRATIVCGRAERCEALIRPGRETVLEALHGREALLELRVDTRPVADGGGYRDASVERVFILAEAIAAPKKRSALGDFLARSKRVHVAFAGIGLAGAIVAAIVHAVR